MKIYPSALLVGATLVCVAFASLSPAKSLVETGPDQMPPRNFPPQR